VFTGLVEGRGRVRGRAERPGEAGLRLEVAAPWLREGLARGDSVAVNGCCLTAAGLIDGGFVADVVPETLRRTALGRLRPGEEVNLERPLAAGGRLGGHLVQGHVDGLGRVLARAAATGGAELRIGLDPELARYVVVKGSIAVDGVSLTVAAAGPDWFTVALVPHTLEVTTLGRRAPGDLVQLEADVIAKYVERLLGAWSGVPQPPQPPQPAGPPAAGPRPGEAGGG
jgi:riboflavin synthase